MIEPNVDMWHNHVFRSITEHLQIDVDFADASGQEVVAKLQVNDFLFISTNVYDVFNLETIFQFCGEKLNRMSESVYYNRRVLKSVTGKGAKPILLLSMAVIILLHRYSAQIYLLNRRVYVTT